MPGLSRRRHQELLPQLRRDACPTTSCCPRAAARSTCSCQGHRRLEDHLRRHRPQLEHRPAAARKVREVRRGRRRCSSPTTPTVSPTCRLPTLMYASFKKSGKIASFLGVKPWPRAITSRQHRDGGRSPTSRARRNHRDPHQRRLLRPHEQEVFDYMQARRGAGGSSRSAASSPKGSCTPIPTTASGPAWTRSRRST